MDINIARSMVLDALQRASSQSSEVLKPAETKLKEWETEPGFYAILLNIFSDHSIDVHARWLAVLYFKNGVDRYWRKTAPNAISEAEKSTLRQGLVSNFREPVNQIAVQLAVLVSKVARFDCPREWPELVPTLLSAVRSEDQLVQHRVLLTLHHVVKTLSSKRLAGDRRLFEDLTRTVFTFVYELWHNHLETFLKLMSEDDSGMVSSLEKALLSLRILRKLTVHGFKRPHESVDAVTFLKVVFDRAKTMLECRKSLQNKSQSPELCEKFIIHLTKVLADVLEHHPFSFIPFIRMTLEFSVYYIFTPAGEGLLFERFVIQQLNLIKGILICIEYKPSKVVEVTKEPATVEAHQIKMAFFVPPTLTEMCHKLVTQYFPLTREELRLWDDNPEGFATDEGGESWKYSLRPCTQTLFVTIFHEYRDVLSPILLEMIRNNHDPVPPSDLEGILRKDAVYNAVGLAAFDLYDEVDFDRWFTSTLVTELGIRDPNYRIIRRRVAWLVGHWAGVKMSRELRPMLYAATLPLLSRDEDMAVRIAAANTLKLAIDDFEFNTEQFLSFLEPAFGLLFSVLREANECDTKMQILYVLSFIVERVGAAVRPHSTALVRYLPSLWEESAEHNMLRCAIVSTLVHLVQAMGSECVSLSPFLLPVIRLSTDVTQDCHVYLLEDGLDLWLAVLENSAYITNELMLLFRNMPPLLEFSSENLRTCFYIIQAYVLLAPNEFLKEYGTAVVSACNDMLSDMRSEGIVMTMHLLELCLRAEPAQSMELLKPMLPRIFEAVYRGEEYPMVMSVYLSIVARVLLGSRNVFGEMVEKVSQHVSLPQEQVLDKLMDVWLDKMDVVTQLERRKLLGLALSSLLTAGSRVVLEKFCGILLKVTEALNDVIKADEMGAQLDSLMISDASGSFPYEEVEQHTEHDLRRKRLTTQDPVHTVVLRDYFQQQVMQLKSQLGSVQYEDLLQTVDVETMAQTKEYIVL
ncbi:importin-11 [Hetaerina americana]|uniref:importin-11 n=1 Tax=Hetaerina americana TaxID=62018 RepID=UPI003A7F2E16